MSPRGPAGGNGGTSEGAGGASKGYDVDAVDVALFSDEGKIRCVMSVYVCVCVPCVRAWK